MRNLLPRAAFDRLSTSEVLQLGLSLHCAWRGLYVEWFGRGAILFVIPERS